MIDAATGIALVAAAGSAFAVFKFWKEQGATEAIAREAQDGLKQLRSEFTTFKIETEKSMAAQVVNERRFTDALEAIRRDVDDMRRDIGKLTERIDTF